MQKALGLQFAEVVDEIAMQRVLGAKIRRFDDPLLLADAHIKEYATEDGTKTFVCFGEDTFRYSQEEGWMESSDRDLAPWVRATLQRLSDERARIASELTGSTKKPVPVAKRLVSETIGAMQSDCRLRVLTTAQAPFWLESENDWDPDDLLVFHNCILNVRHYIENRGEYTIPRTPKLFYEHQIQFDFDPRPSEPVEWFKFLDSLERPSDWREFLQQIMGYCLWLKYDLQKFFVFVGPRRSGKGTIANLLTNLLGGESAVCSPDLEHFATDFGLEQAIGKRLAIVPEIRLPDKHQTQIVARLKAITGGDLVTVNRKHIRALPLRLKMKIVMATNNFVALPDNSGALQSRMLPLKLTKSFFGKEDLKLAEKLRAE
ncbi:MAG: DUF5906 domain-containing protein [Planctomycetota bacterium]